MRLLKVHFVLGVRTLIWLQNIAKGQSKSVPGKFHGLILKLIMLKKYIYEIKIIKSVKFVDLTYEFYCQVNSQDENLTLSNQHLSFKKFVKKDF